MASAEDLARQVARSAGFEIPSASELEMRRRSREPDPDEGLAPAPQVDRYPTILGQGLTLSSLAAAARLALVGYRAQYVDLLVELRHKDAHAISVLQKRVLSVANAKLEIAPFDDEDEESVAVADMVRDHLDAIPALQKCLAHLQWAIYFGLNALEVHWERAGSEWRVSRLSTIHSRRLAFPDQSRWDLYVWDQGFVSGGRFWSPTTGYYGLRIKDYPGKFVVHEASLLGEYPTREGIGHVMATWSILKLIGARGAARYLERFAQPWPDVSYATKDDGVPRTASDEDKSDAISAMGRIGTGSLNGWVHADAVKLELKTGDAGGGKSAKITFKDWLAYCDAEHSKAALGGTLTTEVGSSGGNRALGGTQKKDEQTLKQYDATCLAQTVRRDLVATIVRLNAPAHAEKLPHVSLLIEDEPDGMEIIERGKAAAAGGVAVDADEIAKRAGVPVVPRGDKTMRRMFVAKAMDPRDVDVDVAGDSDEISKKYPKPLPTAFQQERGGEAAPDDAAGAGATVEESKKPAPDEAPANDAEKET